ncbi:MAG: hypothetical protein VX908_02750 [Planctomycetota bacterium]|nr:hypothetical protein [Planctomycetota bacterium]
MSFKSDNFAGIMTMLGLLAGIYILLYIFDTDWKLDLAIVGGFALVCAIKVWMDTEDEKNTTKGG